MSTYRKNSEILNGVEYTGKPKRINQNTLLYDARGGNKVIRLHLTDIAILRPDGGVSLFTGGWKTVTTKDRINGALDKWALGYQIIQERGIWYVASHDYYGCHKETKGVRAPFYEGITIIPGEPLRQQPDAEATEKALLKKIAAYCKTLNKLEELPEPSTGDCWLCCMHDTETDKPWGEGDKSHLISHLDELYIHGSLIVNALQARGYPDPALIWRMGLRDTIVRAMRRYFKSQLGLAV